MTADSVAPSVELRWWRPARPAPWWRIPLYPATYLPSLVLLIWSQTGTHPSMVVRPVIVALLASVLLTWLLAALMKDRDRAGLAAATILLAIIATDDRASALLIGVGVAVVVDGLVHRGRASIAGVLATRVLTLISVILLIATGIVIVQSGTLVGAATDLTAPELPPQGAVTGDMPDMYVILLDAYPGDRAAALATDFDPEAFPTKLVERGFDVDRDSHSNYLLTPLTLVSLWSMQHIVDIASLRPPFRSRSSDWFRVRQAIGASPVMSELRAAGYEVDAIDAGYAHARVSRVDRLFEQSGPTELELVVIKKTRLEAIIETIAPGTLAEHYRQRIRHVLDTLDKIAREPHSRPRLVFAHVPAPHPPWVYRSDGSERSPSSSGFGGEDGLTSQQALDVGFDQAAYIATQIVQTVDSIRATSGIDPVIVVMSDHGPGNGFDPSRPLTSGLEARASSFMAALTPGHPGLIRPRLTPVNLFAVLLDAYLGGHRPRQPDSIWGWRDSYLDAIPAPPITGWSP